MPVTIRLVCYCFEVWDDRYGWHFTAVYRRPRSDLWWGNGCCFLRIAWSVRLRPGRHFYNIIVSSASCIRWRKHERSVCVMATL
jgi:hypothetical protein